MRTITFNELRRIKDSLPTGSMHRIADELGLNVDTVRNFFGGHNFKEGKSVDLHYEYRFQYLHSQAHSLISELLHKSEYGSGSCVASCLL